MKEVGEIDWIEKKGNEINFASEKMRKAVLIIIFFDNFVYFVIKLYLFTSYKNVFFVHFQFLL